MAQEKEADREFDKAMKMFFLFVKGNDLEMLVAGGSSLGDLADIFAGMLKKAMTSQAVRFALRPSWCERHSANGDRTPSPSTGGGLDAGARRGPDEHAERGPRGAVCAPHAALCRDPAVRGRRQRPWPLEGPRGRRTHAAPRWRAGRGGPT